MMKFLFPIFLFFAIMPVRSQEMDKFYYILGYYWDFSVPLNYEGNLKSEKMGFQMNGSKIGNIYRFSEVTGFKFKKDRAERDCLNCHEFYKFIGIPSFYKLRNFYDFRYVKIRENYYGFGEEEVEKQQGFFKPEIFKNVTQQQMKSYLAGAYIDSGRMKEDTVKIEFHQAVNQKITLIKNFINAIGGAKYLKVLPNERDGEIYGPTLVFVPNKELLDLFKNEENRINELSNGIKNK